MGALILILLIGGLFAVLIVPRQRELRRHQALVASVRVGDEIMTGSGLYGRIVELDADFAHLEIAPGVVIKLARRAVMAKVDPEADRGPTGAEPAIDVTDTGLAPGAEADGGADADPDPKSAGQTEVDADADDPARPSER